LLADTDMLTLESLRNLWRFQLLTQHAIASIIDWVANDELHGRKRLLPAWLTILTFPWRIWERLPKPQSWYPVSQPRLDPGQDDTPNPIQSILHQSSYCGCCIVWDRPTGNIVRTTHRNELGPTSLRWTGYSVLFMNFFLTNEREYAQLCSSYKRVHCRTITYSWMWVPMCSWKWVQRTTEVSC
jgi:hypothetical protein